MLDRLSFLDGFSCCAPAASSAPPSGFEAVAISSLDGVSRAIRCAGGTAPVRTVVFDSIAPLLLHHGVGAVTRFLQSLRSSEDSSALSSTAPLSPVVVHCHGDCEPAVWLRETVPLCAAVLSVAYAAGGGAGGGGGVVARARAGAGTTGDRDCCSGTVELTEVHPMVRRGGASSLMPVSMRVCTCVPVCRCAGVPVCVCVPVSMRVCVCLCVPVWLCAWVCALVGTSVVGLFCLDGCRL